jgi:hypothetical protein
MNTLRKGWWRVTVPLAIVAGIAALPLVAHAGVTGGCDGSVTIEGVTYGPGNDSASNPIVVPIDKDGVTADWQGEVNFENQNHQGEIGIVVGPWTIQIGEWSDPNPGDTRSASGSYSIDEFKDEFPVPDALIPRGLYEVSGSHAASGGSCEGRVMVELEGTGVLGIGSAIGAGITLITLIGSGFGRRV